MQLALRGSEQWCMHIVGAENHIRSRQPTRAFRDVIYRQILVAWSVASK